MPISYEVNIFSEIGKGFSSVQGFPSSFNVPCSQIKPDK